jgi:integrase
MAVRKNERDKWVVHILYRHPDGREERVRQTSPVQTRRGAEAHERQIRQALQDGSWQRAKEAKKASKEETSLKVGGEPPMDTIGRFQARYFELCKANDEKPGSLENKRSQFRAHLIPVFGDRRLDSFTRADQNTLRLRFIGLAANTYNNAATVLNSVLEVAETEKIITEIPYVFKMLPRPKGTKDFYEPEVYEALVAAARRLDDTTAEVAVLVPGEAGLRRGECYPLRWRNCRLRERKLIVEEAEVIIDGERHKGEPKGRNMRTLDMTDRLAEALGRHYSRRRSETQIFVQKNGRPYTDHSWRTLMARVEKEAGLKRTTGKTHKYRHTFCSHLAMLGVPTANIQEMAGHESITTTEGYMHLSPASRESAMQRLNNRAVLLGVGDGANIGATP